MFKPTYVLLVSAFMTLVADSTSAAQVRVTASNRLPIARQSQAIELTRSQLARLGTNNLQLLQVRDAQGAQLVCQAVDTDFDAYHLPDSLIFQADFAPNETKTFTVLPGRKQVLEKKDFKAFGRFVRERFDDFAWENDRIAHRMYGKALQTWAGEPLTSSTVDIWSKRVPRMVINDWYLADDYHTDHGEGADLYSAGESRGCGGSGVMETGKLWTSKNFVSSRVLASGPIRVLFELDYEPFEVNGKRIRETKRICLDAGSQLDCFESTYHWEASSGAEPLVIAAGIKKTKDAVYNYDPGLGILSVWEKIAKNGGMQGIAVIASSQPKGAAEDSLNRLLLIPCDQGLNVRYWAGFCWDKAGVFATYDGWKAYLADFAKGLKSPIAVSVSETN